MVSSSLPYRALRTNVHMHVRMYIHVHPKQKHNNPLTFRRIFHSRVVAC